MEILNIGPLELIIVLLIMFILLGPKEMILTAQRIGRWIRNFVRSPMWREIMGYSQEIRELPQKLMDDTGLKEALDDVKQTTTQTANELNATVREAVQEARVPEVEHLKIETARQAVPAEIKPAAEGQASALPEAGEEQTIAPPDAPAESGGAAVLAAAGETAAAAGTDELPPPKPRRGRARKTLEAAPEPAPAQAGEPPAAPETMPAAEAAGPGSEAEAAPETPKPRRGRARKTLEAAPEAAPETMPAAEAAGPGSEAEAAPETPKPRRGRARKTLEAAPEAAPAQAEPAAVSAPARPEPEVLTGPAAANRSAVEALAAQVRALTAASAPARSEPAPQPPAPEPSAPRRGRPRKAAEAAPEPAGGTAPDLPAGADSAPSPRQRTGARSARPLSSAEPGGNGGAQTGRETLAEDVPGREEAAHSAS